MITILPKTNRKSKVSFPALHLFLLQQLAEEEIVTDLLREVCMQFWFEMGYKNTSWDQGS